MRDGRRARARFSDVFIRRSGSQSYDTRGSAFVPSPLVPVASRIDPRCFPPRTTPLDPPSRASQRSPAPPRLVIVSPSRRVQRLASVVDSSTGARIPGRMHDQGHAREDMYFREEEVTALQQLVKKARAQARASEGHDVDAAEIGS